MSGIYDDAKGGERQPMADSKACNHMRLHIDRCCSHDIVKFLFERGIGNGHVRAEDRRIGRSRDCLQQSARPGGVGGLRPGAKAPAIPKLMMLRQPALMALSIASAGFRPC